MLMKRSSKRRRRMKVSASKQGRKDAVCQSNRGGVRSQQTAPASAHSLSLPSRIFCWTRSSFPLQSFKTTDFDMTWRGWARPRSPWPNQRSHSPRLFAVTSTKDIWYSSRRERKREGRKNGGGLAQKCPHTASGSQFSAITSSPPS